MQMAVDGMTLIWHLTPIIRKDIETIFQSDQMSLGLDLFGDGRVYAEHS